MDNNQRKVLSSEKETTTQEEGEQKVERTRGKSVIKNEDGTTSYVDSEIVHKTGTGFIGEPTKIEEYSLGVSQGDTKYVDAIKSKEDLAIMYDDKLITYIKVKSFERILQLMKESLGTYFDSLAYGIYSSEEIYELRNSLRVEAPKKDTFTATFDLYMEGENKLNKFSKLTENLFDNVQKQFDRIKEEERKRKAEEEARKKAEEEEARRKAEEEEEARRKAEEEEARRKAEEEEARRKAEEEEARRKAEEEARKKAEEEARKKAEEEDRKKAEEEARKKAEAEAKKRKKEEFERKKKEAEEALKKKKDEEKRKKKEAEEALKKKKEEEKKRREEEEKELKRRQAQKKKRKT